MPLYYYTCDKNEDERCKLAGLPEEFFEGKDIGVAVVLETPYVTCDADGQIDSNSPLVWVENHGMFDNKEIVCPVCKGQTRKMMGAVQSYIKGNCYLDVEGCRRDMNIYKLQKDDPYGHMRQPGEKDDLISRIKRGNKAKPLIFPLSTKKNSS